MSGDQYPKREGRGITIQGDEQGLVQRDLDKVFRALAGKKATLSSLTMGGVTVTSITTTVADPGVDTKIPTEQAVREAIDDYGPWAALWAMFLGAS